MRKTCIQANGARFSLLELDKEWKINSYRSYDICYFATERYTCSYLRFPFQLTLVVIRMPAGFENEDLLSNEKEAGTKIGKHLRNGDIETHSYKLSTMKRLLERRENKTNISAYTVSRTHTA